MSTELPQEDLDTLNAQRAQLQEQIARVAVNIRDVVIKDIPRYLTVLLYLNPGWDAQCNTLDNFEDVRAIQARLQAQGVALGSTTDPEASGPGSITLTDPDGNPVLIDQHV